MDNLIKNGQRVKDHWRWVADDEPVPDGKVIVSTERLLREGVLLIGPDRKLGVRLDPGEEIESIQALLPGLSLIALTFDKFTDGRHYSTARLLRERYRFRGEIRAEGEVLLDQLRFMQRCGIDAFKLSEDQDPQQALRILGSAANPNPARDATANWARLSDTPYPATA